MSELPKGWVKAKLKEVSIKCVQNKPENEEELIYVDIGSINRDLKVIENPQYLKGSAAPSRARKRINTNDVLVSLTRPNLNAVAHITKEYDEQYASTGFEVIKSVGVDSRYIFALVKTQDFINSISGVVQGALYPAAKSSDVQNYDFPLAPLNEQIRIADKLDSILAKVDAAQARLDKTPNILKRFRQSVLAAATSGELTKEWRGDIDFGQLTKIGSLTKDIKYGTSKKCGYEPEKTPVLRIPNIGNGGINLSDLKYADFDDKELDKLKLKKGDILVIRSNGSVELVGKAAIIEEKNTHCLYAGYLIRIRFNTELVVPKYIMYALQSPAIRNVIEINSRSTSGINNINSKELANLSFLLPEYKEQEEIVRRVESLFSMADTVEKQFNVAKAKINRLTQSILAKAFRGELVPQSPNDEPAEKLLDRIQSELKKQPKTKVKRTTSKKPVVKNMKLTDAPENYLKNLMPKDGTEIHAKQLWQDSKMDIDDFYAQLKKEIINIEEINNSLDPDARTLKLTKE